jgi:hypothetical protein
MSCSFYRPTQPTGRRLALILMHTACVVFVETRSGFAGQGIRGSRDKWLMRWLLDPESIRKMIRAYPGRLDRSASEDICWVSWPIIGGKLLPHYLLSYCIWRVS